MSVDKKYYDTLGVKENATPEEIKSHFKKQSKRLHPDKNQEDPNATQKFQELNTAYQVLSDPEKRSLYDRFGEDLGKNQGFGQQGGGFDDIDLNDVINRMRQAHGFGGGFQQDPREQANINVNIKIDLIDSINEKGISKKFKYNKKTICSDCGGKKGESSETCQECGGSGMQTFRHGFTLIQRTCQHCGGQGVTIKNPCKKCNATGLKAEQEQIDVHIPAGALFTGVTIPGKGDEMLINGSKHVGDLYIQIQPNTHPEYQMDQQGNLHKELEVSVIDCIVGEQVKFKYLDNSEKLFKLKQGSKEGEVYRLNNIGITTPNGDRTNLHIHLKQKYPTKLTDEQIKSLKSIKV